MEVVYKKDLRSNYLVIPKEESGNEEPHCLRMLKANTIPGIIRPDKRIIDNRVLYYYDITSRQSMEIIYEKTSINYKQLKSFFLNLTEIMDQTYEYLLNENDLLLDPRYIFTDLASGKINICYLPGYNTDIQKQLTSLIEYIMNKVEYKDNKAVLYIYNLYAACRKDGFSYCKFQLKIKESKQDDPFMPQAGKSKSGAHNPDKAEELPQAVNSGRQIPLMQEKISNDREKYYYPLKTYIYTALCCLSAALILTAGFKTKIIYTSLGTRIDFGKLTFLLLMIIAVTGYLLKKIWDRKNMLTKMVRELEYIDPQIYAEGPDERSFPSDGRDQGTSISRYSGLNKAYEVNEADEPDKAYETHEDLNPTVLLNAKEMAVGCLLEPKEDDINGVIRIREFPFVIGKQKKNVDYCLDKEVVSRYHVKITKEGDKFYITDLNSTNGTALNKNPLSCYQRYELKEGDEVAIAGIKYIFHKTD